MVDAHTQVVAVELGLLGPLLGTLEDRDASAETRHRAWDLNGIVRGNKEGEC